MNGIIIYEGKSDKARCSPFCLRDSIVPYIHSYMSLDQINKLEKYNTTHKFMKISQIPSISTEEFILRVLTTSRFLDFNFKA